MAGGPAGFEYPVLLERVMKGEFVHHDIVDTNKELHTVSKSFFNKVGIKAFVDLITDHPQYPKFVDDIKEANPVHFVWRGNELDELKIYRPFAEAIQTGEKDPAEFLEVALGKAIDDHLFYTNAALYPLGRL